MKPIPVYEPLLTGNEQRYLSEALNSGWVSSEGPFVERFEAAMARRVDRSYGVAVSSGTMALQIALQALDLPAGSEVIIPAFTIISVALAVIRGCALQGCGCVPVLVDADPNTWNMDVTQIEAAITPKTRAIVMVHTYGLPCDVTPILALAIRHNLFVVEDAAQMHGALYAGTACGSFGDLSIFSFYANKLVTTGEGGMVLTDSPALADRCRHLRNLAHSSHRFVHSELAWNARMTNLQAAVGCAQLERLDEFVAIKRTCGRRYTELLKDIPSLQLPVRSTDYADNIYWAYGVVLPARPCAATAAQVMTFLDAQGIGTRPFFCPMNQQRPVIPYLALRLRSTATGGVPQEMREPSRYPIADLLYRYGFYLPGGLTLADADQVRVADALRRVLRP
jgi:perosamine synthetase